MKWTKDYLINKVFYNYLTISILGMIAATIGMLVDGIVIGQYLGTACVSAFGLVSPVFILMAAVAGIFSNGGTACCTNYIGRGEKEKISLNFTVTSLVTILTGAAGMAVCLIFAEQIAVFLGADSTLITFTADYIKGIGLGSIFIMYSQVVMLYIRTDNDSGLTFISVLCMTACNIALDILFGVILEWGMFGMGLATSISYVVSTAVCMLHFLRKNNIFKLTSLRGGAKEIVAVINTGIPSALNRGCMTVRGIFLNHLLMSISGASAVSALAVQNNINQLLSSVTMGVGMTTMLMAGIFYGERDEKSLQKTLKVSLKSGIMISTVVAVLTIIFARPVVGMFLSSDAETMALAVRSLRMFCLSLPLSLTCVVLLNFYQCTRNLLMANMICLFHGLIFVAIFSGGLSGILGTDGVWISFLCAEISTLVLTIVIIKVKKKVKMNSFKPLMMLPDNFQVAADRTLDISIPNNMEAVMTLSERISEFCGRFTEDSSRVEKLSLCIEEMAGNIVLYGFKDKKPVKHYIDIKIIMEENGIYFSIRDDGIAFNPLTYIPDEEKTITSGIRLIQKMVISMDYKNTLGMNHLSVRL